MVSTLVLLNFLSCLNNELWYWSLSWNKHFLTKNQNSFSEIVKGSLRSYGSVMSYRGHSRGGQQRHPEFSPHPVSGIDFKTVFRLPSQQSACTGLERKGRWEEPIAFHSTLRSHAGRDLLPPSMDSSESKKQSSRLNRKTSKCGGSPSASTLGSSPPGGCALGLSK